MTMLMERPVVPAPGQGERFAAFCRGYVRHTKGEWAGQPFILEPFQREFVDELFEVDPASGRRVYQEAVLGIPRKNGKALALDTPIPTPQGWAAQGTLRPGDEVFDETGRSCRVTGVTKPMLGRPCYRVTFSDGSSVVADAAHEWYVEPHHGKPTIIETVDMVGRLKTGNRPTHNEHRYRLPVAGALDTEGAELPVAPYTLGAWLGDGHTAAARITVADAEVLEGITADGYRVGPASRSMAYGIGLGDRVGGVVALQTVMRREGLIGRKHIPQPYLRASMSQRLALLQGLMDTDGFVSPRGQCEFTTTKLELAEGVLELIRTLGMKPTAHEKRATLNGRDIGPKWRIQFFPPVGLVVFRIGRKVERLQAAKTGRRRSESRYIVGVEPVESVPVRCIEVDSPSHLYLAGEAMVPTHNSTLAAALGLYFLTAAGENGPEVYCAAAARHQAAIVFGQARDFVNASADLRGLARPRQYHIDGLVSGGKFVVLASDAQKEHGLNPSATIIDELHAHENGELYTALTTAGGARPEPITVTITTAGFDEETVLGRIYTRAMALPGLERRPHLTIARDRANGFLMYWYGVQPGEDAESPEAWAGANPAPWITSEYLRRQRDKPTMRREDFDRLHLNVWTSGEQEWLPKGAWEACEDRSVHLDRKLPVGVGIDKGQTHDTAAVVVAQKQDERVVVRARVWANPYPATHTLHDAWEVSSEEIREHLRELASLYPAPMTVDDYGRTVPGPSFAYDPWHFSESAEILQGERMAMTKFPQTHQFMGPASTSTFELIKGKRLVHDGDPVLSAHVRNATAELTPRGWKVSKPKKSTTKKNDAAVALTMAVSQAILEPPKPRSERKARVPVGF